MIAVFDYGIGNIASADKALQRAGAETWRVPGPADLSRATGFVLPGVGAFGATVAAIDRAGLGDAVRSRAVEAAAGGRPFLGICVGLQLLFEGSEEDPSAPGLGLLAGRVEEISPEERRPQMQWNIVKRRRGAVSRLLGPKDEEWFYFAHSYVPRPGPGSESAVVATCAYGGELAVAFEQENLFGTQFHPEKSSSAGLGLLGRFAGLCR